MLETENPTFANILEYISDKKTNYFEKFIDADLRTYDKEERKIESRIMTVISKLRLKNKTFDKAYSNLFCGHVKAGQESVSKRDLTTLVYLNLLPEKSKVILAQILNSRRTEAGLRPIIAKPRDNEVNEYKELSIDGKIESVEDFFNKQLVDTVEGYYHKISSKMSERDEEYLNWDRAPRSGCEIDKMYKELLATTLLAEHLGFNIERILEKSDSGNLYSFVKRGVLITRGHNKY